MTHAEIDILSLGRLAGKYGFTNRVIDGISLTITNLTFQIKAHGFKASIFVSGFSSTVRIIEADLSLILSYQVSTYTAPRPMENKWTR